MLKALLGRNIRLFFKDKGMFFTSLITPVILLVLYVSFLGNVFRDTFEQIFSPFGEVSESILSACVGGQLMSSILAVCCVTVPFCANFLMVQDKVTGARRDFAVSPAPHSTLALSYYLATLTSSLLICLVATGITMIYLSFVGWYLSIANVLWILLDVCLLVFFGTALSSVINSFLSTQGQISAVGTIVSSGYGFLCGAYMPISQFSDALQKLLSFLPGTYGTALLRTHCLTDAFRAAEKEGIPSRVIEECERAMDCRIFVLDHAVSVPMMYLILGGTVALLLILYVFMNRKKEIKG